MLPVTGLTDQGSIYEGSEQDKVVLVGSRGSLPGNSGSQISVVEEKDVKIEEVISWYLDLQIMQDELCSVCEEYIAEFFCHKCDRKICVECDEVIHLIPEKTVHQRVPLRAKGRNRADGLGYGRSPHDTRMGGGDAKFQQQLNETLSQNWTEFQQMTSGHYGQLYSSAEEKSAPEQMYGRQSSIENERPQSTKSIDEQMPSMLDFYKAGQHTEVYNQNGTYHDDQDSFEDKCKVPWEPPDDDDDDDENSKPLAPPPSNLGYEKSEDVQEPKPQNQTAGPMEQYSNLALNSPTAESDNLQKPAAALVAAGMTGLEKNSTVPDDALAKLKDTQSSPNERSPASGVHADSNQLRQKFVQRGAASFVAQLRDTKDNSDMLFSAGIKAFPVPRDQNGVIVISSELQEPLVFGCGQAKLFQETLEAFVTLSGCSNPNPLNRPQVLHRHRLRHPRQLVEA
eukprot:757403-Hanusia_phi.AAC.6